MNESRPPNQSRDDADTGSDSEAEPTTGRDTPKGSPEPDESGAATDTGREAAPDHASTADETPPAEAEAEASSPEGEAGAGGAGAVDDRRRANDKGDRRPSKAPLVIAVIAILAALGVGAFAGYLAQRLEALEAELAAVPGEREAIIEEAVAGVDASSEIRQLASRLDAESEAREALRARFEEQSEELQAGLADVRELAVGHHTRWRLAEVRYLVGIGVRRLQLAEDPDGAAAAFEAADEALHRLGDARLLPLRQALVEDLARIRGLEPVDVEGIALRLLNLERAVERLPLARSEPETAAPVDPDAPLWEQLLDRLRGLVVVRHRDAEPVGGLPAMIDGLPPRDALGLALRQARHAALNGDTAGYRQGIESARELVAETLDRESRVVEEFDARLVELADRRVRMAIPDLSPTLERVAEVTARLEAERERARERAEDDDE